MTDLRIQGTLLTADRESRTLSYRLLPYGEQGRTNLGTITASAGALTIPEDVTALVGNLQHDPTRPVSRFVSVTEEDDGLRAVLRILPTSAGDDLLIEAAEGVRTGISIEVADPVIRKGALVGGSLSGAGHVTFPAFPSATLAAADVGDDPEPGEPPSQGEPIEPSPTEGEESEEDDVTTTTDPEVTASAPATAPPGLAASRSQQAPRRASAETPHQAAALMAAYHGGDRSPELLAALVDITYTGVGEDIAVPQWIGRLWEGVAYDRRIVPLLSRDTLRSLKIMGWKWGTKPEMDDYAGDKAPVPSGPVTTDPVSTDAKRLAGAHDHDRAFVDFPTPGYWEGYYAAMAESYARLTDAAALAVLEADATPVTVGTGTTGIGLGVQALVDAALAVVPVAAPTFGIMATDLYRDLLLTPADQVIDLLSQSLGLDGGSTLGFTLVPSADIAAGTVIVGARSAVTFYELGGGAPIRVDALNIANGGVDTGLFGYFATITHEAAALAKVDSADY